MRLNPETEFFIKTENIDFIFYCTALDLYQIQRLLAHVRFNFSDADDKKGW